jgi:hypothetical protein
MEKARAQAEALEALLRAPPPEAWVKKGWAACAAAEAARRRLLAAVEGCPASAVALAAAIRAPTAADRAAAERAAEEGNTEAVVAAVTARLCPPPRLRDAVADVAALRRRLASLPDARPGQTVYEPLPVFQGA